MPLSIEQAKELLGLCRAGKLYEVESWIAAGNSLQVPPEIKKTPLQIAVALGFHSLVKLLAIHESSASVLNRALSDAVALRNVALVELLLEHSAAISSTPLADVLLTWEPSLIRLFLNKGTDVLTGYPFTVAFTEKIRTALRPFIEFRQAHPELADELQKQVDRALRYFCREADLKWVSLLLWAGGNPRSMGPVFLDPDEPECYVTALQQATSFGHVEVLKRLKPDPEHDDLTDLLGYAIYGSRKDIIRYLLELGAKPNDKPNGGSSALGRCLLHLDFEAAFSVHSGLPRGVYSVRNSLENVRELAEHGAVWKPDERSETNSLRKTLLKCEPEVSIELLKILVPSHACSKETLQELFSGPRLREHLAKQEWWLSRLKLRDMLANSGGKRRGVAGPPFTVSRELSSRYDREELYNKVWTQPVQKLAKAYGISDVALAKTCRKLHIPLPGRGYWAKKAAGRAVPKKPTLPSVVCS